MSVVVTVAQNPPVVADPIHQDVQMRMVGISVPTVDRDLRFARAWLNRVLS